MNHESRDMINDDARRGTLMSRCALRVEGCNTGGTETTFEYEIGSTRGVAQSFDYGAVGEDAYSEGDETGVVLGPFRRRLAASPVLAVSKKLLEFPEEERRRLAFENPCSRRLTEEMTEEERRRLGLEGCLTKGKGTSSSMEVTLGREAGRERSSSSTVSVSAEINLCVRPA